MCEVAQYIKGLAVQNRWPEFNSQNPRAGRREPTSASCLWPSHMCHGYLDVQTLTSSPSPPPSPSTRMHPVEQHFMVQTHRPAFPIQFCKTPARQLNRLFALCLSSDTDARTMSMIHTKQSWLNLKGRRLFLMASSVQGLASGFYDEKDGYRRLTVWGLCWILRILATDGHICSWGLLSNSIPFTELTKKVTPTLQTAFDTWRFPAASFLESVP
jgi:hypothetical protein